MPSTSPAPAGATLKVMEGGRGHLLTVRVVAARLGVSRATIYELCGSGALPHARVSNAVRIAPADVAAFIASRKA